MKNYRGPASPLTITAPTTVASGEAFVMGALLVVAAHAAASGTDVSVEIGGAVELPAIAGQQYALFQRLYWDAELKALTTSSLGNLLAGIAVAPKTLGATFARVLLRRAASPAVAFDEDWGLAGDPGDSDDWGLLTDPVASIEDWGLVTDPA